MTDTLTDKTEAIEESETLVKQLRAIEKVPFYFEIDKKKAYKEVFEKWREKNSLLNSAIKGEINITEEYEAFLNEFAGARNYYPHYESDERYKKVDNELTAIIGYFAMDNANNVAANPIFMGGIGITTTVMGVKRGSRGNITRREFIKFVSQIGLMPICSGVAFSSLRSICQYQGREGAFYVQSKINEVYKL